MKITPPPSNAGSHEPCCALRIAPSVLLLLEGTRSRRPVVMHACKSTPYVIKAVMFPTVSFARTHRIRHLSVILKEESTFHWDFRTDHPNSISASAPIIPFRWGNMKIGGRLRSSRLADFSACFQFYFTHTQTHTDTHGHTRNGNLSWRSIDRIKVEFSTR